MRPTVTEATIRFGGSQLACFWDNEEDIGELRGKLTQIWEEHANSV